MGGGGGVGGIKGQQSTAHFELTKNKFLTFFGGGGGGGMCSSLSR